MDMKTARELSASIFDLIELCAEFEAQYPNRKPLLLNIDDTGEAWAHAKRIYDKQREIARLLDSEAIEGEGKPVGQQYLWRGQMTAGHANKIHQMLGNMVMTLAKERVKPSSLNMPLKYQFTIARMLDPDAVRNRAE